MPLLIAAAAWVAVFLPARASAQEVAEAARRAIDAAEAEMRLPGGTGPILALMEEAPTPPDIAILNVIRLLHLTPPDQVSAARMAAPRVASYLAAVQALDAAMKGIDDNGPGAGDGTGPGTSAGISLAMAANGGQRRQLERLFGALGMSLSKASGSYLVRLDASAPAATAWRGLAAAGIDVKAVAERLNAGEKVALDLPVEMLPLPIGAATWRTAVFKGDVDQPNLAFSILGSRDPALLYYGAMALDAPTQAALAADSRLMRSLTGQRAAAFAAFGRSLRIRDGRIVAPGGPGTEPLWEALVGRKVGATREFIQELFARDGGALAWFYDTIGHLDPARARYASLGWMAGGQRRYERFLALYATFRRAHPGDDWANHPLARRAFDPALALLLAPLGDDGSPPPARWQRLWSEAFSEPSLPQPGLRFSLPRDAQPVDAAWLVDRVMTDSRTRSRMEAVNFSWRVFSDHADEASGDVLVALRGFVLFPTLMLTLERTGVRTPDLYAAAARAADTLTSRVPRKAAPLGLVQFQAALALVDRARFRRTIDAAAAESLIASLVRLGLDENGRYRGAVCRWLDQAFIPAVTGGAGTTNATTTDAEKAVLQALAGRDESRDAPELNWGTARFRVDAAGAEYDRLRRLRSAHAANSLTSILDFWRASEALAAATSIEAIAPLADTLAAAAASLTPVPESTLLGEVEDFSRAVERAEDAVAGIARSGQLQRLPRETRDLLLAADALVADSLASIVYAASAGEEDSRVQIVGNAARLHDLSLEPDAAAPSGPWMLPEEEAKQGRRWHLRNSLLALETALALDALPRLVGSPPPHAPTIGIADQQGIALTSWMTNPFDLDDTSRDEIAAAIRRGRERLASMAGKEIPFVDEWRGQALTRRLRTAPEEAESFVSLSELLRLGEPDRSIDLDAWGASGLALHGCLCLRQPLATGWETLAGRGVATVMASHLSDLSLALAEHMAASDVPARLAQAVLAHATVWFRTEALLAYHDDWLGAVAQAKRLDRQRFEEIVDLLMTTGLLVPVEGSGEAWAMPWELK